MDMGFKNSKGERMPGVSSFYKKDGKVYRHATSPFGPGDMYCATWHLMDLLKDGVTDFQAKFQLP
jgi:predicted dithiol-disulfide oxidoreductase (DUF899 family)